MTQLPSPSLESLWDSLRHIMPYKQMEKAHSNSPFVVTLNVYIFTNITWLTFT